MKSNFCRLYVTLTALAVVGITAVPAQAALLVSSSSTNSIKQYDETTGNFIRDFVTSGSGGLSFPEGLTLGPNGNLFVSSSGNSVKEYNGATGAYIRDFVTSGSGGLAGANGLTFGPDSNLYVVSSSSASSTPNTTSTGVLEYNGTTGDFVRSIVTDSLPSFNSPPVFTAQDVASGTNGNLFISSSNPRAGGGFIRDYNPTTGNLGSLYFSLPSGPDAPGYLTFGPNGNLFFTDVLYGGVDEVNVATGASQQFIPYGSGGLSGNTGLAFGPDGNLFVGSSNTNSIKEYNGNTGDYIRDFVSANSGGLSNPTYLTFASVPVPEPVSQFSWGFLAFGALLGLALKRKHKALTNRQLTS